MYNTAISPLEIAFALANLGVEVADVVRALALVVWAAPAWVRTL